MTFGGVPGARLFVSQSSRSEPVRERVVKSRQPMTSDFKEAVFGTILTSEQGRQRQRACRVKLRVVNVFTELRRPNDRLLSHRRQLAADQTARRNSCCTLLLHPRRSSESPCHLEPLLDSCYNAACSSTHTTAIQTDRTLFVGLRLVHGPCSPRPDIPKRE